MGCPCLSPPDQKRLTADSQLELADALRAAGARVKALDVPWFGQWLYHLFPYRRGVVLGNLRRVFGGVLPETELIRVAQAYYGHYVRFLVELVKLPLMSAERKKHFIRLESPISTPAARRAWWWIFFGPPAGTFKSPALIAMASGAPVIPATSWREPDGSHVLRFEDPIPLVECEDTGEAIRQNTRAFNAALECLLLRHPEQWIWMHKRWKVRG